MSVMKKVNLTHLILFFALILIGVIGCKHHPEITLDIPNNNNNGGGVNPNDTVYFTNTILPLITSRCAMSGCHDAPTDENRDVVLNTYNDIMLFVEPFSLSGSELWDDAINETDPDKIMPPLDATPLTAAEIALIEEWILQGALNNTRTECDSTFAFAADILPIIENNCTGCHSGNDPEAGLMLVTHSDIQTAVISNGLMARVNNSDNPMPPSNELSDCIKSQLQSWIDDGMPNN
jgi:uncharacterized membrane protein